MTANSFLEYFLVLFGWVMNNAMWSILSSTGLFALPLVFKVLGVWLKVREEGADEGNKGILALPRIEHAIYVSFLVMLFCCIPLLPVDISTIKFDSSRAKQCGVSVPTPQSSGYKGLVNDFDGRTAEVPVWWYHDYYTAMTPRSQWPYDSARDSGYPDTGQGGYPTCKTWWSDGSSGLRQRVLASFSEDTRKEMQRQFPGTQWETLALQWLVSPRNAGLSGGGTTYAVGSADNTTGVAGNLTRLTSTIGLGLKQEEALPGFDALKQALPMIQALLQMMIITVIPVLMMFSAYEPKTIVTISFALFALQFITFWWELAGWLDDWLITILYDNMAEQGLTGSAVPLADFVSSTNDGWIMNLVLGMMYVVFPAFWMGMLSWVGVKIGGVIDSAMASASKMPQQAGNEGGKAAIDTVKSAATKV